MGPAEKGKRMHRVHCVKEHMGAGEGGTALLLTLMESRLGPVDVSGPIMPIGAQAPTGLLVLLSEALGGVGCGPASEHQLLGFSAL